MNYPEGAKGTDVCLFFGKLAARGVQSDSPALPINAGTKGTLHQTEERNRSFLEKFNNEVPKLKANNVG